MWSQRPAELFAHSRLTHGDLELVFRVDKLQRCYKLLQITHLLDFTSLFALAVANTSTALLRLGPYKVKVKS